ncbi:MAG: recombinase RecT, partial [Steroidobacteraceae bacterium]|nr:recombinase RecT [Steroidobacteraceae bacterium]
MRAQDEYKQWQVTLQAQAPTFAEMLPADVPIQRFIKIALNAIWQDPELLKCSKRSLIRAFLMASRAGLLPDGREGVILAFRERRRDGEEFNAQFIPMVAGLVQLAYRAGVKTIITDVVRENDEWELERGDYPRIVHRPKIDPAEGGRMIWAYAIAVMPDDTRHHAWVSGAYIEKVRQSSRAPDGRLWTVWQEQAWKKTAIRQLFKSLPLARGEPAERLQAATEA